MQDNYFEEQIIKDKKFRNVSKAICKFVDCSFENCLFEECRILNCIFVNCRFENCTVISLEAKYSEIKNGDFQRCNLIGVHWEELFPTGKYACPIEQIKNCCLKYNTFADADFRKADFSDNIIQESMFDGCDLQESNFQNCRLEKTQFTRCDIRKSDFRNSSGYVIDIVSNKLKQAKFSYPEVVRLLNSLEIQID